MISDPLAADIKHKRAKSRRFLALESIISDPRVRWWIKWTIQWECRVHDGGNDCVRILKIRRSRVEDRIFLSLFLYFISFELVEDPTCCIPLVIPSSSLATAIHNMVCRLFGILLIVAAAAVQGFTPRKSIALTRKQEQDEPHVSRGVDKGTLQVDTTLGAGTCSSTTETALRLSRGGGFASAIANIFVILVRNPGLLIGMCHATSISRQDLTHSPLFISFLSRVPNL